MTKQELIKTIFNDWSANSFCKGAFARDKTNTAVAIDSPDACKWCVFGRIYLSIPNWSFTTYISENVELIQELREDFYSKHGVFLANYNDSHTLDEVKEALETLY